MIVLHVNMSCEEVFHPLLENHRDTIEHRGNMELHTKYRPWPIHIIYIYTQSSIYICINTYAYSTYIKHTRIGSSRILLRDVFGSERPQPGRPFGGEWPSQPGVMV